MPNKNSNKKNVVLVVDDEPQIRKFIRISLKYEGYKIEECENGTQAVRLANLCKPDLIILDLGLPDIDGKDVIAQIREFSPVPIIVCSVRSHEKEIVEAFDNGADDYITKPFNSSIMLARIAANLRKSAKREAGDSSVTNGAIHMDLVRHEVHINGKITFFTPKEYELLRYFMVHRSEMLSHKKILHDVWGPAHSNDMQYLRVYVSQLREKVEPNIKNPTYIVTEPGIGYRMEEVHIAAQQDASVESEEKILSNA